MLLLLSHKFYAKVVQCSTLLKAAGYDRIMPTRPKIKSCNGLLKTGCNNAARGTLFLVVNNIEQYC